MEPNNIEKQFREKLNAREIQPSAQAWDRLDAMLSVAEEKKTKRSFGWLYIAASVLVLVSLGLFLFNPKNTEIQPANEVVGTEIKKDSATGSKESIVAPIIKSQPQESVATTEKQSIIINSQRGSIINHHQKTTVNQSPTNPNQINRNKEIEFQNSSDVALKDLPVIDARKEIVIKSNVNVKSDESLLADLDNAAKQSAGKDQNVKISAKSLLSQVDGEVEYTFREKTLQKLSRNYQEIKVALANRNNKE